MSINEKELNEVKLGKSDDPNNNDNIKANIKLERAVVRKVDLRLIPIITFMYTISVIDRVSIGLARLYNFEEDFNITPFEYSVCLSIFFIGYILFEIPSNIFLKKLSPQIWFSVLLIVWGGSTMCLAASTGFVSLASFRFILGLAESGLFPGIIFYLSYWYPRQEQGTRISVFGSSGIFLSSLNGLLVYYIKDLNNVANLKSWQWIFIIEGLPAISLGLIAWFLIPESPEKCKFLNVEEKAILLQKLKKSHVELNVKHFDWSQLRPMFRDTKIYIFMLMSFTTLLSSHTVNLLSPTIINNLGFDSSITSLLTVPQILTGTIFSVIMAWNSDRIMERSFHIISCQLLSISGFILIQIVKNQYIRYFSIIILTSGNITSTNLIITWLNNNMLGSTVSAFATPLVFMSGSIGGIVAGQLYPPSDAPNYLISHNLNILSLSISVICACILRYIMKSSNDKKNDDQKEVLSDEKPEGFRYML